MPVAGTMPTPPAARDGGLTVTDITSNQSQSSYCHLLVPHLLLTVLIWAIQEVDIGVRRANNSQQGEFVKQDLDWENQTIMHT
jgi:hypothetical protein